MIPAYQRSELEYDNRIKRRLNKGLEKKYTNQQLIKFQGQDARADDLFLSLEKMLYLIYALLQESHTYLFAIGTQSEEANRRERHPLPPTPERPQRGRQRLFPTGEEIGQHVQHAMEQNQRSVVRTITGVGSFRSQMGQLLKLGNTLKEYIKDISPRFNYLDQEQVNRLDQLIKMVYEIYDDTLAFALQELQLARGIGANEELVASQQLIGEVNKEVIQRLPALQQLIVNYNPIVAPVNAGSVNQNASGDGYTLDAGNYLGQYV